MRMHLIAAALGAAFLSTVCHAQTPATGTTEPLPAPWQKVQDDYDALGVDIAAAQAALAKVQADYAGFNDDLTAAFLSNFVMPPPPAPIIVVAPPPVVTPPPVVVPPPPVVVAAPPPPAASVPHVVQRAITADVGGNARATFSAAFPKPVAAGDTVIAFLSWDTGGATAAATAPKLADDKGDALAPIDVTFSAAHNQAGATFVLSGAAASPLSFGATFAAAHPYTRMLLVELSGVGAVEAHGILEQDLIAGGANIIKTSAFLTAHAGDPVWSGTQIIDGGSNVANVSPAVGYAAGYADVPTVPTVPMFDALGTLPPSWSYAGAASSWITAGIAFAPAP